MAEVLHYHSERKKMHTSTRLFALALILISAGASALGYGTYKNFEKYENENQAAQVEPGREHDRTNADIAGGGLIAISMGMLFAATGASLRGNE